MIPDNVYRGVVLLGWMDREQAVRFLMEDCWSETPMSVASATLQWDRARSIAAALPNRQALAPKRNPLTAREQDHARLFKEYLRTVGAQGVDAIKIDPMELVVGQYCVVTDLAARYLAGCPGEDEWLAQALPVGSSNPQLTASFARNNRDTEIRIDLPHAEFIFGPNPQGGFGPKELMRHVAVTEYAGRMMLNKGYHRIYARMVAAQGRLPDRLSLVAVDSGTLAPAPAPMQPGQPKDLEDPTGLSVFGVRPALMADFFTEGLATSVFVRKKRYQLQVSARWIALPV